MGTTFKTIALIGKYKSPEIAKPLLRLASFLEARGVNVVIDKLTATHIGKHVYAALDLKEIGHKVDLAIVLGGDGTMLNIARALAPFDVPLIGVNQGRLGFLTDISLDTMLETIGAVLEGKYISENRMLVQGEVFRDEASIFQTQALNDIVISKGAHGSLIEVDVCVDGLFVYTLRSDGLIVATPTGSTAYALSSDGPILHPNLSAIVLVPVCPHTLSNRPIVVSSESVIEMRVVEGADTRAYFDSHSNFDLKENDKIVVTRYPQAIRLLQPTGHSYYHTLREKLHWSETY